MHWASKATADYKQLGDYLFVKYLDGNIKKEADESFAAVLVHAVELIAYFKVFSVFYLPPDAVVLDLNHPLAKDRVRFVGEVGEVREATPEELSPKAGCGCGCGCGGNTKPMLELRKRDSLLSDSAVRSMPS